MYLAVVDYMLSEAAGFLSTAATLCPDVFLPLIPADIEACVA